MKKSFILAFSLLSIAQILILLLGIALPVKAAAVPVLSGAVLFFLYRMSGRTSDTRKARDRVSTAVIGLLHSTNSISSLQAYNDLIRRSIAQGEDPGILLDQERAIIEEYSGKVKAIVSDLSSSFRTGREKTDLAALAAQSAEYIRLKRIRDRKIPMELSLPERPVEMEIYPALFKTALENILDNSYDELLEADREESYIALSLKEVDNLVQLTIRDNGRGFRGIVGKVPQNAVKPGLTGRKKGNGLGLYVTLQAVRECGGSLSMVSGEDGLTTSIVFSRR